MTLPSYVINWDELDSLLQDLLSDIVVRSIKDVEGIQKIKGFAQSIPAIQGNYKIIEWTLDKNIVITGVTFSQSSWKGEDYWELWVDDDLLFETVYTKELGDQKHWEVLHPLTKGQIVKLILHNNSGNSRDVWTDLEYLELTGDFVIEVPEEPETIIENSVSSV